MYKLKSKNRIVQVLISLFLLTSSICAEELINGGGNDNGAIDSSAWSTYGASWGLHNRTYNGATFIYSSNGNSADYAQGGMYQGFPTEVGKSYTVSAILIGADTNSNEEFIGSSGITISSAIPNVDRSSVIATSSLISGGTEEMVSFSFTATSATSYLALRSDTTWGYTSARDISVKETGASDVEVDEASEIDNFYEPNSNTLEVVHLTKTLVIGTNNTTLKNKHFICNTQNFSGIKVSATNTLIKGNLFENCATAIELANAYNTTVIGNRFENMGSGIVATNIEENSRIEYNEFVKIGTFDCTVATGGGNCNIYGPRERSKNGIFSHNLVDNRGANSRYMEDYIAIYSGANQFKQNMRVEDNLLVGGLVSSSSGSCFLADGRGSGYVFKGNECYNVSGYGMAIASAKNALVEDNLIYMDEEHVKAITRFNSSQILDGSYTFAATDFYAGECASNVTFINNRGYSYFEYTGNIGYGWRCLGVDGGYFDLEGTYANNITLHGNQFLESDPKWKIPNNIFDNLDSRYFSGNSH